MDNSLILTWAVGGLLGVLFVMVGGIYWDIRDRLKGKASATVCQNTHKMIDEKLGNIEKKSEASGKTLRRIELGLVQAGVMEPDDLNGGRG